MRNAFVLCARTLAGGSFHPLLAQLSHVHFALQLISHSGKWATRSLKPTENETHPGINLMKLSSSALTFLQLQKGLQLQSNSSLLPQLLQEPQIPGYF